MSYEVLARKWRPRSFPELVGQDHVGRALVNALDTDRLHHAYLFAGTRGVGKTTIARILAKSLNCERHGVSSEPCGECGACQEVDAGRFVDLIEVDALARQAADLEPVLGELLALLHQLALAQTVPGALDESIGDADRVRALAERIDPADVQLYYQIGTLGRRDLGWAPDPRTGLEMTLLRMLAFRPAGASDVQAPGAGSTGGGLDAGADKAAEGGGAASA
ncbi:MAG: hypothetical protein BRD57_03040, partial [Proteobacteria bacterium SW_6_67_9]